MYEIFQVGQKKVWSGLGGGRFLDREWSENKEIEK